MSTRVTVCAPEAGKIMRCRDVGTTVNAGDKITELTGVGKETWELFVAYRRADAPGHAGRIGERLININYFGPGRKLEPDSTTTRAKLDND